MTEFERELSNLSYTNKDFSTIYPELLDLAKKLSYKWDPTTSNESDPGVVLLKLAALMADKTNYNIDKNILELFPLSVSQDTNARQIFEQCGYCMKHYQAASAIVTLSFASDPELKDITYPTEEDKRNAIRRYDIPRFTMVTNADSSNVFTIIEPAFVDSSGYAHAIDIEALQGVAMNYAINGDTLITAENLDYKNRLYFSETNIAENGIFITNRNSENYDDWVKVDNLLIQPEKTRCYKFGLTDGGATCYIEFPQDIVELIDEGINITYILTDGASGNIGKNRLTNWYGDISLNVWDRAVPDTVETVAITNENIKISNVLPATSGKDPETIDEAYTNYERIKTTFDTLVNTTDYSNALVTSNSASNGFVCDRTNDVQSSYVIMNTDLDTRRNTYVVKSNERQVTVDIPIGELDNKTVLTNVKAVVKEPELDAFDLRIYAFEYTDNEGTLKSFVRSFAVTDDYGVESLKTGYFGSIHELKSINHNFQDFIDNRIILLKNKYPLIARIIPSFKLTPAQQSEIITRVTDALYKQLHSSNVSFAEAGAYDIIYDTIVAADPRIKALALDDLTYETYAVFKNQGKFYELRIDDGSQGYYRVESMSSDMLTQDKDYYVYDPAEDTYEKTTTFKTNEAYYTLEFEDQWKSFRKEIYARSVLAANTTLFEDDNLVSWSANMIVDTDKMTDEAYYLKTATSLTFEQNASGVYQLNGNKQNIHTQMYGVQPNENVIFTKPALLTKKSYASYVKVLYDIAYLENHETDGDPTLDEFGNPLVLYKNAEYTLRENDCIIFMWKSEDSDYAPYSYIRYGAGTIISPSYDMRAQTLDIKVEVGEGEGKTLSTKKALVTDIYNFDAIFPECSGTASSLQFNNGYTEDCGAPTVIGGNTGLVKPSFVLSGERQIDIKESNTITLPKNIYFMLNDESYTMFDEYHLDSRKRVQDDGSTWSFEESYTLQTGEYLIYTNESKTQLVMLEGGTKITRRYTHHSEQPREPWHIDAYHQVTNSEFISQGVDAIDNHWYIIDPVEADGVTATETEYVQLGANILVELDFDSIDLSEEELAAIDAKKPANEQARNNLIQTEKDKKLQQRLGKNDDGTNRLIVKGDTVKDSEGNDIVAEENKIVWKSGQMPLPSCRIRYATLETDTWHRTELTYINGSDLTWQLYALLNVTCSDKTYQRLQAHQVIKVLNSDQEEVESYSDCYIKSNVSINGTGPLINTQTWNTSTSAYVPSSIVSFLIEDEDTTATGTANLFKFVQSSNEGTCSLSGPRVTISMLKGNKFNPGTYRDTDNNVTFRYNQQDKKGTLTKESDSINNIQFTWSEEHGYATSGSLKATVSSNGLLTIERTNEQEYTEFPSTMTFNMYDFSAGSDKTAIIFNLPAGDYLLPISLANPYTTLNVTLQKIGDYTYNNAAQTAYSAEEHVDVIQNIYSSPENKINWQSTTGRYFLQLHLPGGTFEARHTNGAEVLATVRSYQLLFNGSITDANSIVIGAPYKYTYEKYKKSKSMNKYPYRPTDFNEVLTYIVSLDSTRTFNYTYQIPQEYLIKCPTSAAAFLDTNHCMNPYTICQWDVYSKYNSILVLNKLKQ